MSMKQKKETKAKIAALEAAIGTESTEGTPSLQGLKLWKMLKLQANKEPEAVKW